VSASSRIIYVSEIIEYRFRFSSIRRPHLLHLTFRAFRIGSVPGVAQDGIDHPFAPTGLFVPKTLTMNQFIQRIVNHVANEIIIKGLANSRTFQRFVVKTDKSLQDLHKTSTETLSSAVNEFASQQIRSTSTSAAGAAAARAGPPQPPLTGFAGFVSAFIKEVRKDLAGT
jgi:hypothetical protein